MIARYLPGLLGSITEEPLSDELAQDPAMYWSIVLLDLGLVVPASVATAAALFRGSAIGSKAALALLGWFTLVPISVAAMALVMLINDDPHKSAGTSALLTGAAALFAAFALWVHWPLLRQR